MHSLSRAITAVGLALVVLTSTSCDATSDVFDLSTLETEVSASLALAYEPEGFTLIDVSCPRSATQAQEGDVFACVADVEGRFVRIRVDVTSDSGYDWTTLDLVLDMEVTAALVAEEMSDRLGDQISLDCGSPKLRVLPVGSAMRCTASDSGDNDVNALLTINGTGQIAWELIR